MKVDLRRYAGQKICVALSGGRDSVALTHYLFKHADEYGIGLFALNCEHGLRGESSLRDSEFVERLCASLDVPLLRYSRDCRALSEELGLGEEEAARIWRRECYADASEKLGGALIATAHHADDNAETVLFNIARGSAIDGACGIDGETSFICNGKKVVLVRPLVACTREDIDGYIASNGLEFVEDESNRSTQFTRNYIRFNVLSQLSDAVPNAVRGIYRFSRLAADDEDYFSRKIAEEGLLERNAYGVRIRRCGERVIFRRAALSALKMLDPNIKDYTFEHLNRLFELQSLPKGKKFEFLGFSAVSEDEGVLIGDFSASENDGYAVDLRDYIAENREEFCGVKLKLTPQYARNNGIFEKIGNGLFADLDAFPEGAQIRFRREGDAFEKFGGGRKSLGDFFTDRKVPVYARAKIPLICDGGEALVVCGVEISEKVKITDKTKNALNIVID